MGTEIELIKALRSLYFADCVLACSKLAAFMEERGWFKEEAQADAIDAFFDPTIREQLKSLLGSHGAGEPPRLLINDWQLRLVAKGALLYGSTNRHKSLGNIQRRRTFARALLVANDLRAGDRPSSGYANWAALRTNVQEILLRELGAQQQQEFLYLLARHYDLFLHLPNDPQIKSKADYMDVRDEFLKATGVDLLTFMAAGFSVLSHYLAATSLVSPNFMLKKSAFFKQSAVSRTERDACFDLLSTNREQYRKDHRRKYPRGLGLLFDFVHLQRRPLIRLRPGWYAPVTTGDLVKRVSAGVYWDIHDHLVGKRRDQFQRLYGDLLELYVQRAFRRTLPSGTGLVKRLFCDLIYRVRGQEHRTSDVIVFAEKDAIFLDVTVGRLRMTETLVTGSFSAFKKDIQAKLVTKAKQIDRVIRDFKEGRFVLDGWHPSSVARYYPVIVVDSPLPIILQTYEELLEMVESSGALTCQDIERLVVLSIEDIERMEPIVESGQGWLELLRGKINDPAEKMFPMKFYLDTLPAEIRQRNRYLSDVFSAEAEKMPKMLFPTLTP